mmetsp:Transcript_29554/g.98766  ORF Transcript_29554/g.98766 Transcript_29554/m.98766 type:complete len:139 (+) Transcript_29554:1-417(+)
MRMGYSRFSAGFAAKAQRGTDERGVVRNLGTRSTGQSIAAEHRGLAGVELAGQDGRPSMSERATKDPLDHKWLSRKQMQTIYDNPKMGPTQLAKLIRIHKDGDGSGARTVAAVRTRAQGRDRSEYIAQQLARRAAARA